MDAAMPRALLEPVVALEASMPASTPTETMATISADTITSIRAKPDCSRRSLLRSRATGPGMVRGERAIWVLSAADSHTCGFQTWPGHLDQIRKRRRAGRDGPPVNFQATEGAWL